MDFAFVAGAALLAGMVNAIAGGGSLLSFPALVEVGLPKLIANLTNTVAMCPGYFGAAIAQRRDLAGQGKRMATLLPVSAVGGAGGALLLLATGEGAFDVVVPFLLLFAALLLAAQTRVRKLARHRRGLGWSVPPVALAAIYGGYFGAGMGVIVLATLAVVLDDDIIRANALKQTVSLVVNVSGAIVFVISGRVAWNYALAVAPAALVGGAIGGRIASRVPPAVLRWTVVTVALGLACYYFYALF
jgi:uncharacterized membrane protein YfcA